MNAETPPLGAMMLPRAFVPSSLPRPLKLRLGLLGFGVFLGVGGLWLLLPELLQPKAIALPQDRNSAVAASSYQTRTLQAATIGMIRGNLWARVGFADSILLWRDRQAPLDRATATRLARAKDRMQTALALAPINGPGWLFLALLPAASASAESRVAALLELSYFTAPNALDIAPLRIERAATSGALAEKDIQEFVKADIRKILAYRPHMKSAIIAAYRNAWPQNQPIFEALATEVDPAFGQALRAAQPK